MRSRQVFKLLRSFESPNVTFIDPDGSWPVVWEKARGSSVWDAEGRKYLDLTAAFGVAVAGHANQRVVRAGQKQMAALLHAMGDVHPHALKAQLARELSRLTFERFSRGATGKTIFCNSGFEAVEAALKTALLATGRPGVIAFSGAYHGLGYGALSLTHRRFFRSPFQSQLAEFGHFVPFPSAASGDPKRLKDVETQLLKILRSGSIGAILVEPIQGRGGINVPHPKFLPLLRSLCDKHGALLIFDEIFTGFGRTGRWFAGEHFRTAPDIICLGKALTGGFPLSACVGRADIMDAAWPPSSGEALHTSTFLGHPVGCAMALANIAEIRTRDLVQRSERMGDQLLRQLKEEVKHPKLTISVRGKGLMAGLEVRRKDGAAASAEVWNTVKGMLQRGSIILPEGEDGNVISLTPPLVITQKELDSAVAALSDEIGRL